MTITEVIDKNSNSGFTLPSFTLLPFVILYFLYLLVVIAITVLLISENPSFLPVQRYFL
jgi:hypothetical protein